MIVLRITAILVIAGVAGLLNAARVNMPFTPDYDRILAVESIGRDGKPVVKTSDEDAGQTPEVNDDPATDPDDPSDDEEAADRAAIEKFKAHYEAGNLVIDARPKVEFEKGHLDAAMVLNVPSDAYMDHLDFLYSFQASPIMIYCTSKTCDMAEDLKYSLEQIGFMDLHVFKLGWEDGIKKYDLPQATGPAMIGG